jgi:uncharacterized damage-inducible protein DinB
MTQMPIPDLKALIHARLQQEQATLWQKVEDLPEWQQRMPWTPTGSNLLGIVKHVAFVEAGYFGSCWGRPVPGIPDYATNWDDHPEMDDDDDLWAFPDESPEDVFRWSRAAAEHMDRLIEEQPLEARGFVPWWGPEGRGREASLGELMMHMLNELSRHLGHVDILRELTDGAVGYREGASNIPEHRTAAEWSARRAKLTGVAEATKPSSAAH